MKRGWLVVFTMLVMTSALPAMAQHFHRNEISVSGLIGVNFPDLGSNLEDYGDMKGIGFDRSGEFMFGVAVEYHILDWLGVEGTGFLAIGDFGTGGRDDLNTWSFQGNVVGHIPTKTIFEPYLTGGIGITVLDSDLGDSSTRFSGNVGAGVDIFAFNSDRISIRIDSRLFFYSFEPDVLGPGSQFDDSVVDFTIQGGIRYGF